MTEENKKYKYNQGDRVFFDMGNSIRGYAKIVGCSTEPMEGLGRGWIVEIEEESRTIDKSRYPFTNIVVYDIMIKKEPEKEL